MWLVVSYGKSPRVARSTSLPQDRLRYFVWSYLLFSTYSYSQFTFNVGGFESFPGPSSYKWFFEWIPPMSSYKNAINALLSRVLWSVTEKDGWVWPWLSWPADHWHQSTEYTKPSKQLTHLLLLQRYAEPYSLERIILYQHTIPYYTESKIWQFVCSFLCFSRRSRVSYDG